MAIIITGDAKLQAKFKRLARSIKNRRPMFKRIGVKLLQSINTNFEEEGNDGQPWKPLSFATLQARRGGTSGKILQDTGTLKNSFVMEATNNQVKVGTPIIYAPTHEEGRGNIPERPFMPEKKLALSVAIDVANGYIKEQAIKSGL